MNKIKTWLKDNSLLVWVSVLIAFGAFAICSMGAFNTYLPFLIGGIMLLVACGSLPQKWLMRVCIILGLICVGLILKTVIAPEYIAGSARYTHVFGVNIDPCMLMLPAYVVLIAYCLNKQRWWLNLACFIITLLIMLIALHLPYVFMALVYGVLFTALFLTNTKRKMLYIGLLLCMLTFVAISMSFLPFVQTRLLSAFHAGENNVLWYIRNMIINSQFIGANSIAESYLLKTPSAPTFYMLYAIGAKFGILAMLTVLFAEYKLISNLWRKKVNGKDGFAKMLFVGTITLLALGVLVQLLTPVMYGLSWYLPFVSLGGTAVLAYCMLIGFTYRVGADNEKL